MSIESIPDPISSPETEPTVEVPEGEGGQSPNRTINATFSSVEAFRSEEPELFEAMMEGLAMSIVSRMRKHNERMKKLMREGRQDRR